MPARTEDWPWEHPFASARSGSIRKSEGAGDTFLWEYPPGEASPGRSSCATLRCDPARRPGRTALSRFFSLSFIPIREWWGKAESSRGRCCVRWSVCWWGRTRLSVLPSTVRHNIKKIILKLKKKILPPLYKRNGFLYFFRNLFSTLYNIYFSQLLKISIRYPVN